METKLLPVHPGEILLEEFLKPMGISQYRVAHSVHVPPRRINPDYTLEIKFLP